MIILDRLRALAQTAPAATALAGTDQQLGYRTLLRRIIQATAVFEAAGSRVVGLMADNGIDWIVADLAALNARITLVPIPPYFTPSQRRHLMNESDVDTLVIDKRFCGTGEYGDGFEPLAGSIGSLGLLGRSNRQRAHPGRLDSTAKITFTSGSTGAPKGVCLSFETVDAVSERLRGLLGQMAIDRHLCVMPLATLLENIAGVYVPLMLGATVYVPSLSDLGLYGSSRLDAAKFAQTIEAVSAESLILQPELLRALTTVYDQRGRACPSLRFVAVGGAKVSAADLEAAAAMGIPAYQGYGLSECASVVALNLPDDSRPDSVGRPLPGIRVSISDGGEILVHGQHMLGYLGEDGVHGDVIATGDIGYLDGDGFLYVTGRRKNVFITSYGRNVSPEWPEAELLHRPEIAQACVFGEGRPVNTAVIVPAGTDVSGDDLAAAIDSVNRNLPDYARISNWVIAAGPFTCSNGCLTATGKPRRDAVEKKFLEGYLRAASAGAHGVSHESNPDATRTPV